MGSDDITNVKIENLELLLTHCEHVKCLVIPKV